MNLRTSSSSAGFGQGLMEGIQGGIDLGNAIQGNRRANRIMELREQQAQRQRTIDQQRMEDWTVEKAKRLEEAELMATTGIGNALLNMQDGAKINVDFPMSETMRVIFRNKKPTSVELKGGTYNFYDDKGQLIAPVSKDQVAFNTDRAQQMLGMFYNKRMKGVGTAADGGYKGISRDVIRGGKKVAEIYGREQEGTGLREYSRTDVQNANRGQSQALRIYMDRLREYTAKGNEPDADQVKELDALWESTGALPNAAYHRGGKGIPSEGRGIGIPMSQTYEDSPNDQAGGIRPMQQGQQFQTAEQLKQALLSGSVTPQQADQIAAQNGW